jgi:arylsulfatase A-like enzyme
VSLARTERSPTRTRNGWLLAALAVASACGGCHPRGPERIVLVVVDTLRSDHLSVYGSQVETPHVDALAARGQVFTEVFASFHQTSMSMAAMFTGRTPSIESGDPRKPLAWNSSTWCGLARFLDDPSTDTCIPRSLPTLAERLQEAGYWTVGVASNQFLYEPSGFGRGFDDWTEVDEREPVAGPRSRQGLADPYRSRYWRTVNEAVFRAVDRAPRRFFLYVHYIDVHDYRFQKQSYAEAVAVADHALGRLMAGLEQRGLVDGAVVVFTSDHGERLGEDHRFPGELPRNVGHFGNPSFEEVLRIPLIVAPPVFPDTGRFLRTEDLYTLVQEIAGVEVEPASDTEADELFVSEQKFRTYRKGRWKVSFRREDGRAFLYDLEADPQQLDNVSKKYRLQVLTHRNRVNQLTGDLGTQLAVERGLSEEDRQRLRILGYLEEE